MTPDEYRDYNQTEFTMYAGIVYCPDCASSRVIRRKVRQRKTALPHDVPRKIARCHECAVIQWAKRNPDRAKMLRRSCAR